MAILLAAIGAINLTELTPAVSGDTMARAETPSGQVLTSEPLPLPTAVTAPGTMPQIEGVRPTGNGGSFWGRLAAFQKTYEPTEGTLASIVTSADRLHVKVQGHPTLTGDYRINGDETLTIPALGRIKVTGLTFENLERLLDTEVLRLTGREGAATVEVLEYRDVFVSGLVSKAGSFPWKRGMTVLHAETLAGGLYRPTALNGSPIPADGEKTRALRAAADLARLLAQQARLKVEQTPASTFDPGERIKQLAKDVEIEPIIAAELSVLKSHRGTYEAQVAALARNKQSAAEEIESLQGQQERISSQLAKRRELQQKIAELARKGIITNERVLNEQARVVELEERAANVSYSMSRVKAAAIAADRDLEVLRLQSAANLETERLKVERDIAQLEIEVESASTSFRKMTGQSALPQGDKPQEPALLYQIVRNDGANGHSRTITAERSTALMPGDILMVTMREGR